PDILLRRSTDGGATWSPPVRVNDDPAGTGVDHRSPHLAIGANGVIQVTWFDRRNAHTPVRPECNNPLSRPGLGDVYLASSSDGGATFSPNRRVTDRLIDWDVGLDCRIASANLLGPVVAPLAGTGAIVAWADSRDGSIYTNDQEIFLARTLDT